MYASERHLEMEV
jgi:hypothetical protein